MSNFPIEIVIDTNIIFMSWHNPIGKCAEILRKAREGKIKLFSPDTVKLEIIKIFQRNGYLDWEINYFLNDLPINWIEKELYVSMIGKTKVKHKPDKPIEAVALSLNCKILSADQHFDIVKQKIDIDDLLKQID